MNLISYAVITIGICLISADGYAATLMGKVAVYSSNSNPEIYPLVSGNRMAYGREAVIRISGGTLITDKGAVIKAVEQAEAVAFEIERGEVYFRLRPQKVRVTFKTPHGEITSPKVAPASYSMIEGKITVGGNDTTVVQVSEGALEAKTSQGIAKVEAGQGIVLAQSKVAQGEIESQPTTAEVSPLPSELLQLLQLAGERGTARTPLTPEGGIDLAQLKTWDGEGEIVDYNLKVKEDTSVPKGTAVKVVCVRVKGENESELLVRPEDRFYPEKSGEISLVGKKVVTSSELDPEGTSDLEKIEGRSTENWDSVVVDGELQPIEGASTPEGTAMRVVCIRSTLLLQPTNQAKHDLIGKDAIANTDLTPNGKVLADGKTWDGVLVDYNLQPIEDATLPKGSELIIVGVKGGNTLLTQSVDIVQEELSLVGKTATAQTECKPYCNVLIDGESWWGVVVDNDLKPITARASQNYQIAQAKGMETASDADVQIAQSQQYTVIGIQSTLLLQSDPVLLAAFFPTATAASLTPLLLIPPVITPPIVGIIIDNDPPGSPITP